MSKKQPIWKQYNNAFTDGFISFLKSNWISILIITVFALLILLMQQGSILLVDLLDRPINLLLFLIITHLLGVVLSLYPVYLSKWRENRLNATKWIMRPNWLKKSVGLGIILYEDAPNEKYKSQHNEGILSGYPKHSNYFFESIFRKFIGAIFYLCILYCLTIIADKYFFFQYLTKENFSIPQLAFFGIAIGVIVFHFFVSFQNRTEKTIQKFKFLLHLFLALSIFFFILSLFFSVQLGWAFETLTMVFIHLFFSLLYFIIYRKFRRVLCQSKSITTSLNWLSNDYDYIKMTTAGGWFSLIIFIWSQFQPEAFNPIVIIFSMFYTFYGLLIIPIKHHLYYSKIPINEPKTNIEKALEFLFIRIFPFTLILYLGFITITSQIKNDQHKLETIPYKHGNLLTDRLFFTSFDKHFKPQESKECQEPVFFISSYGGGLRANVWTLKVLNELTRTPVCKNSSKTVFDNIVSMSGVSGGGFGIALFQAIYSENPNSWAKRDSIINIIGEMNPLSRDLAWLVGSDYLGELNLKGAKNRSNDRAIAVLGDYNNIASRDSSMLNLPFQKYTKRVFDQFGYYPATFINTSSFSQKRGIASSFQFDNFHKVFPNSIDILDIADQKTLSYLNGVSPTHRFPFFSPGAKIENKSIFIDGGYFENSGMLTTFDFYDYLAAQKKLDGRKVVFIQIKNGDMQYAREVINTIENKTSSTIRNVKESGEIATIIKAITSVSSISNYLEEDLELQSKFSGEDIHAVSISLPYRISRKQAKRILFEKQLSQPLIDSIEANNHRIDTYLRQGNSRKYISEVAIEPALGRLLTSKTITYIDQLLMYDASIFKELNIHLNSCSNKEYNEQ